MAVYKTLDLLKKLHEVYQDGFPYVEVSNNADDNSLNFSAIDEFGEGIDYEEVDSCEFPDNPMFESYTANPEDLCCQFLFTFDELGTVLHAIDNALEYVKEESQKKTYSRDDLESMKTSSVRWRNLRAKLMKFYKKICG